MPLCVLPVLAVRGALQAGNRELLAMHDSLTGLPNRTLLLEHAKNALRDRGEGLVAMLFIDLDHFKQVNDAMGHPVGDELLRVVGERLASVIREEDFAARLGGDEFAVICQDLPDIATAFALATRICEALSGPVILQGVSLHVEASIGVALIPTHADEVDVLLQRADVALYQAKAVGPGSVVIYDPSYDNNSIERLTLMAQLRSGLETELVLLYQPKCRLSDGEIVGVEALERWQHPTLGLLYPDRFIPLVEQTDLIDELTDWVVQRSLHDLTALDRHGEILQLSVNVSARNLGHSGFADLVIRELGETGISADRLVIEITETALLADPPGAAIVLTKLNALGVRVSIDDFGCGQTSLGYLSTLPIHELKIDRSFIDDMLVNPAHAAIVRSIVDLGHNLHFHVVGEGVESKAIWDSLRVSGCDSAQGYLLARPMPLEQLSQWLVSSPVAAPRVEV